MIENKKRKSIINSVMEKHSHAKKREITQLSIKIDSEIDSALSTISSSMNISKNKLIEEILIESGIVEEAKKIIYKNSNVKAN